MALIASLGLRHPQILSVDVVTFKGGRSLYKGQILNGIVWFFFVGMGYVALILPGLVLHFFCVLGALSGNPWTRRQNDDSKECR